MDSHEQTKEAKIANRIILGELIKQIRREKGWTREKFAEELSKANPKEKWTSQIVGRIETGRRIFLRQSLLESIGDCLGMRMSEFSKAVDAFQTTRKFRVDAFEMPVPLPKVFINAQTGNVSIKTDAVERFADVPIPKVRIGPKGGLIVIEIEIDPADYR